MATGHVKRLIRDRGFGFVQEAGSAEDTFFHSSGVAAGAFDDLTEGQAVEFDKGADPRDPRKSQAINVRPVS